MIEHKGKNIFSENRKLKDIYTQNDEEIIKY